MKNNIESTKEDNTCVTVRINLKEELAKYELDGKWNDYIAVQKEILKVLREKDFFDNNVVSNNETGMSIRISPKDIRETFSKDKRKHSYRSS